MDHFFKSISVGPLANILHSRSPKRDSYAQARGLDIQDDPIQVDNEVHIHAQRTKNKATGSTSRRLSGSPEERRYAHSAARSQDELRLMGDYSTPRDAVPIALPSPYAIASSSSRNKRTSYGAPRPFDTMNGSRSGVLLGRQSPRVKTYGKRPGASGAFGQLQFDEVPPRSSNRNRVVDLTADPEPAPKRQRREGYLADDLSSPIGIGALSGRAVDQHTTSNLHQKGSPSGDLASSNRKTTRSLGEPFDMLEFRSMNDRLNVHKSKSRAAKDLEEVLANRSQEQPPAHTASHIQPAMPGTHKASSPILVSDDERQTYGIRRGSKVGSLSPTVKESKYFHLGPRLQYPTASAIPKRSVSGASEDDLQEGHTPSVTKNGASAVKPSARIGEVPRFGSPDKEEDELHGETTIPRNKKSPDYFSKYRLSQSPVPRSLLETPSAARDSNHQSSAGRDIRPTVFHSSGRNSVLKTSAKKRSRRTPTETFPLTFFRTDGAGAPLDGLVLSWDHTEKQYHVEAEGPWPGKSIDPKRITLVLTPIDEGLKVVLRGSKNSNGEQPCYLLEFDGRLALNEFLDHLHRVTTIRMVRKESDYLDKLFANDQKQNAWDPSREYSNPLDTEADIVTSKLPLTKPTNAGDSAAKPRANAQVHSQGPSTRPRSENEKLAKDEEIKYETDSSPPRQTSHTSPLAPDSDDHKAETPGLRAIFDTPSLNFAMGKRRAPNRTIRAPSPIIEKYSVVHGLGPTWEFPVVYPEEGTKRTTVEFQDLEKLDDGEFLNDSIIAFYIRYVQEQTTYPTDKVYFFNTFFYSTLTGAGKKKNGINYAAIQKWIKEDIFKYEVLVVPINHELHWHLALICNLPELIRRLDPKLENDGGQGSAQDVGVDLTTDEKKGSKDRPSSLVGADDDIEMLEVDTITAVERLSFSDTEAMRIEEPLTEGKGGNDPTEQKSLQAIEKRRKATKEPVVLILDSLGAPRNVVVRHLKEFLVAEAKAKRDLDLEISDFKGMTAKGIPLQENFCDCGLYLLGYIAKFLQDPTDFVEKAILKEFDEKRDWPELRPSQMRSNIRNLLQDIYQEQKHLRQLRKKAKRDAKAKAQLEATTAPEASQAESGSKKSALDILAGGPREDSRAAKEDDPDEEPQYESTSPAEPKTPVPLADQVVPRRIRSWQDREDELAAHKLRLDKTNQQPIGAPTLPDQRATMKDSAITRPVKDEIDLTEINDTQEAHDASIPESVNTVVEPENVTEIPETPELKPATLPPESLHSKTNPGSSAKERKLSATSATSWEPSWGSPEGMEDPRQVDERGEEIVEVTKEDIVLTPKAGRKPTGPPATSVKKLEKVVNPGTLEQPVPTPTRRTLAYVEIPEGSPSVEPERRRNKGKHI